MKQYIAHFRHRENGRLEDDYKAIKSTSLKDAKITAKTIARQQGLWLMEVR